MRANAKKGAARKCVFMVITRVRTSSNALVGLKLSHLGQTKPIRPFPLHSRSRGRSKVRAFCLERRKAGKAPIFTQI
jgi:hypothetical protein